MWEWIDKFWILMPGMIWIFPWPFGCGPGG